VEDIWLLEEGINRSVNKSCSLRSVRICIHPETSLWWWDQGACHGRKYSKYRKTENA